MFRPYRRPSWARLLAVAIAAAQNVSADTIPLLTRGPYLQLLNQTSATVVWNTATAAACALSFGPLGGLAATIPGPTATVCTIPVSGLTPGTQYTYIPLADGAPLRSESTFHTATATAPFTFLAFGDSGSGGMNQAKVRDRMLLSPADFLLHTGDMVYEDGAAADLNAKFFTPYAELLRHLVLWPCVGNHDVHPIGGSGQPWRDAFATPANNLEHSENYYSFDYGNVHVAVLDSNQRTGYASKQYVFLQQDLATTTARWKVVVFHHSIYSSGTVHGSALSLRANLVPLFDQYHVDLVFMGHEHNYERTLPLVADQPVNNRMGTVYVTTGGGGSTVYPVGHSAFTAYAESAFHFVRVAIDGEALTLSMVRLDGEIRDTLAINKRIVSSTSTTTSAAP